ncbi:MAG TPA: nucleoside triphosphate hydrolase [Legionellales bacterium]|nr:nucleoside triphosphate hydrolase [Legionellales bacterium]
MAFYRRQGEMMDIWQRLVDLEKKSEDFGLKWPDALTILQQIESECREIREHLEKVKPNQKELEEEIGDLMHASMSLAWFLGFDSKNVLEKACNKFKNRLAMMKVIAKEQGYEHLRGKDFKCLLDLWKQVKVRLEG